MLFTLKKRGRYEEKRKKLSDEFLLALILGGSLLSTGTGGALYDKYADLPKIPRTIDDLPKQVCMANSIYSACRDIPEKTRRAQLAVIQADPEGYQREQHGARLAGIMLLSFILPFSIGFHYMVTREEKRRKEDDAPKPS